MVKEYDFLKLVDELSKTSNKRSYASKAKRLIKLSYQKTNAFYPYRLALELDRKGYPISELEDYIISIASASNYNLHYLILLPLNLIGANVHKLQDAVIETYNAELMAEFSKVPYANYELLENLILLSNTPKASFIYISAHKTDKLEEHKQILLRSKKSKYLYKCALLADNKDEFSKIEDLILKNRSYYYMRLLTSLPFADLSKIENRIIATGNFDEIKKLYKVTKSHRLAKYIIIM